MRLFIIGWTLSLLTLLTFPESPVVADGSVIVEDGYQNHGDNIWWYDGIPYTREKVYETHYQYYYGYKQPYYSWYWLYKRVKLPSPKDPDAISKVLDIAAARDKREQIQRLDAQKAKNLIELIDALGLRGNFYLSGYGADPYGTGNYQLSSAGVQGKTVVGYSISSVADLYGSQDPQVLLQQATRLTQNAQQLAGQAHTESLELFKQEGNNRARVAETIAKGQAIAQAGQGVSASNSTRVESKVFTFRVSQDGKIEQVEGGNTFTASSTVTKEFVSIAANKCADCHAGKKPDGDFKVFSLPSMTREVKDKVKERLMSTDPKLRMPKGGPALTKEEIDLLLK